MKRIVLPILVAFTLSAAPLLAKEGSDQYPFGAENWFTGALPPPGFFYVNYFGGYTGKLKDGSGQNALLNGSTPTVDATFNAFRFVEITHLRILGASYGMHAIVPLVHQSVDMNGTAGNTNVGDIFVNPLVLGWNRPNWHAIASADVLLPTGYYNASDPRVSIGAHYYSVDPLLALSYLPKSHWEASAKLMYNIKTTNPTTNYHSGQEFHADYAVGKHLGGWMVGATGYALKQTTNDTVNGQIAPAAAGLWNAGREGQVFAFGPSAGYTNSHHMTFETQWQHETLVCNRFGGDKFWFKLVVPVSGLFGKHDE
jgi:hypothetical protein